MSYSKLSWLCRWGEVSQVQQALTEIDGEIDIFWRDYSLLHTAAQQNFAAFKVLIDYYETRTLKLRKAENASGSEDTESDASYQDWLKSDEYLHARERLAEALRYIVELEGNSLSPEVKAICDSYLDDSTDKDTVAAFEESERELDGEEETTHSSPARSPAESIEENNDAHTTETYHALHEYLIGAATAHSEDTI